MVSLFGENTFYFGLYCGNFTTLFSPFSFFLEPTDLSKLLGSIYKVGVFLFLKTALVKTNKWLNSFWTVHMILLSVLAKWPQALCTSILVVEKKETQWLKLRLRGPSRAVYRIRHRGLKLDGAIGQGEICNSLKSEEFSKSFLSHIGKNKIKF